MICSKQNVIRAVLAQFPSVTASELRSKSSTYKVRLPKEILCALLFEGTGTYSEAGRLLGMHHTSVIDACHRLDVRRVSGDGFAVEALANVRRYLAGPAPPKVERSPRPPLARPASLREAAAALRSQADDMDKLAAWTEELIPRLEVA